jgi:hypothetical protein
MLKGCVLRVQKFGDNAGKLINICTLSTHYDVFLDFRTTFVHKLNTGLGYLSATFSQALNYLNPSYNFNFYTLSTMPINTTNLIKE